MKKYLVFIMILFVTEIPSRVNSQNLEAHYKVEKVIYNTDVYGNRKKLFTLSFDGFLYQKKDRTIYFQRPLYLDDYPDGSFHFKDADGQDQTRFLIPMDTLYHLYYMDFDSLIVRSRIEITGPKGSKYEYNYKQRLIKGVQNWHLLPATKEINGLRCQHAIFSANGGVQWDVWFCADIPVLSGPFLIQDLPGLVIEASSPALDETYVLTSYATNVTPDDAIFWPGIFNQPFK